LKSNLSISRAWEETKAKIAADGRLLLTVALALVALPAAVAQFAAPGSGITRTPQSGWAAMLMIAVWVISLVGQLAIVRLALGPSVSVGEAIVHGARRAPRYIAAVLLIIIAVLLLSVPFVAALAGLGIKFEPGAAPPPPAYIILLLLLALMLFIAVRMVLTSPVASAEPVGPITILKRSWQLTAGHGLRLFGFVLLFVIGAVITLAALTILVGLVVSLVSGEIEPLTVSALILALVEAFASALVTTLFVVMLARIYVQLAGDPTTTTEASVPRSGT
jgi:hypothetical protein